MITLIDEAFPIAHIARKKSLSHFESVYLFFIPFWYGFYEGHHVPLLGTADFADQHSVVNTNFSSPE